MCCGNAFVMKLMFIGVTALAIAVTAFGTFSPGWSVNDYYKMGLFGTECAAQVSQDDRDLGKINKICFEHFKDLPFYTKIVLVVLICSMILQVVSVIYALCSMFMLGCPTTFSPTAGMSVSAAMLNVSAVVTFYYSNIHDVEDSLSKNLEALNRYDVEENLIDQVTSLKSYSLYLEIAAAVILIIAAIISGITQCAIDNQDEEESRRYRERERHRH